MACGEVSTVGGPPDVTTPPGSEPGNPTTEDPAASFLRWEKCSLETGGTDGRAECANVEVPLDWSAPEGKKITFFVKRVLGSAKGPKQQLWLLQGGPGAAGDGLESLAQAIIGRDDSVDIYIPDHRGTGRSAYLDCPRTIEDGWSYGRFCAAEIERTWGKGTLATFSTTSAARDVGFVIENSRLKDQKVHVYGVSYGTYWAQRYLQLFPTQASAVTLDSLCQSGLCSLSKNSYWYDVVGKKYLGECAQDSFCKEKLGPDPVEATRQAFAKADAKTCAALEGFSSYDLRVVFQWFITSVELRVMIPSLVHRINRCNEEDAAPLSAFVDHMRKDFWGFEDPTESGDSAFATQDLSSNALLVNIAMSEMEEEPAPTLSELEALLSDSLFAIPEIETYRLETYQSWPKYRRDEYVGKYPDTATPILMMNGTLDPQTPQDFADAIAPHYAKPNQSYVVFPRAAHCVISQSPTGDDAISEHCGMTVWKQFVANPTRSLDTTCTSKILGHRFDADWSMLAGYMYNQPSLWSPAPKVGSPNGPPPLSPLASKAIENALRRARQDTRLAQLGHYLRARSHRR
jgi:pimeloyl-ACP methyl ester carboxylesterase